MVVVKRHRDPTPMLRSVFLSALLASAHAPASDLPAAVTTVVPPGGGFTASDYAITLPKSLTRGTGSYTFTLTRNGAATGLSCTITAPATSCASPPGVAVTFGPGDRLSSTVSADLNS